MSDIAVAVEHLSKMYRLGVINNGTLWKDLQTWAAIKTGRADPHSKIGEDKYAGDEDHFWALKDLSFEIKQGDRVGIIGKNGAGKSTLLKLLSRITSPTEGSIKVRGKIASLLEVGTGFHGELTGRENIYLNGAILGMKSRQIDRKLDEIISFSGIENHIDTPVKRYSSGMYVRLAFAVAAHLDSEILIADEVLAVGDAEFQKKALGKMQDLSMSQGRTVLFVSHQMTAVRSLCNTGIILRKGQIESIGKIGPLIEEYLTGTSANKLSVSKDEFSYITKSNFIEALSISIDPSSVVDNEIQLNRDVDIVTEYLVKEAGMNCQVSLHLLDTNGNVVFASFNEPSVSLNECKYHGKPYSAGKYRTICRIPAFFLNEGNYSVNLFFVSNRTSIEIAVERALCFDVKDTGEMRKEYVGTWIGAVRPKLYWNTIKLDDLSVEGNNA